jgi:hypothetical protein
MATGSLPMVRQAFPTIEDSVLYSTPNVSTVGVVTNIVVVNTTDVERTFSLSLDDVELFDATPIGAKSTISIDLKQVIETSIKGSASSNLVKVHISGVELS